MTSSIDNLYLEKHSNYPPFLEHAPEKDLSLVVVIPSYNEPDILPTLQSLSSCLYTGFNIEVIVVVNQSEEVADQIVEQNQQTLDQVTAFSESSSYPVYSIFIKDIPAKKAGVGFARKTGMDEAVRRLDGSLTTEKLIVCLDADTVVNPNYLQCIYDYFKAHPKCPAASINYAHCTNHAEEKVNRGIIQYELHLRYYVLAQRWAGLEYAHQTVGSAMAVRTKDYQKQGGMNTRKAGEDFYFIHKFTHYADFGNILGTLIQPSSRVSDRVPFGTGRAMISILNTEEPLTTYAPQSFAAIQKLVNQLPALYEDEHVLKSAEAMSYFLGNHQFSKKLAEIKSNTSDYASFKKRFFRWFDAFTCMKFLHFARDHHYPNVDIRVASNWLNQIKFNGTKELKELELLTIFRAKIKPNS